MQTFLPYANYEQTAKCLDYRRLGKQRVECKQILQVLLGESVAWRNHPAVLMWKGHEQELIKYAIAICKEWRSRGYKDSLLPFFESKYNGNPICPDWLGNDKLHSTHRANLIRKDPVYYGKYGWNESPLNGYWWP